MGEKDIVLYNGKVEVRLGEDTVWLTQKQMAGLFGTGRSVITKHIQNIFKIKELEEKSNVQKMNIANSDKPVKLFSLDVIKPHKTFYVTIHKTCTSKANPGN